MYLLKSHYNTETYWVEVKMSTVTHDLINLSFQCYFCLETLEETESRVDLSTKAHYGSNIWSSLWNLWMIPTMWCRGYPKVTLTNTWCMCAVASLVVYCCYYLFWLLFSELISHLLNTVEPEQVNECHQHAFKWRHFWTAGVDDVWPQDQHDKWGWFSLWLHAGLEAFSGEIN